MALSQLQGLTPLGGGSGGGYGPRPPNGDGTDPYDPNNPQQNQQRRQQQGAPSSYQGSGQGQAPTFAQMQAQGRARPAPPQDPSGLANQTNQAASQALSNPSAYGAPQVQQAMDTLNQGLATQALLGRRQIDETMAQRGLYDSTATGDKYGQLQAQQDTARAQYATQLAQTAAQTYGADRSAAIQNAGALQNQQATQGLGQQAQNLNQALGYGNLGVSQQQANTAQAGTYGGLSLQQAGLTGQLNGQSTLGAQSLGLQAQQQAQNYALGQGQLGVAQQQANTGQQSVENQYNLGQGSLGLQSALGYGGLGIQQGQLNLAQQTQAQNYGLGQQSLAAQEAYQGGQIGLGQAQINASLLNQQRQSVGNLAYAGLLNGTAPSSDWTNFLMSNQGQSNNSLYQVPNTYGYGSGNGGSTQPSQGIGGSGGYSFPGSLTPNYSQLGPSGGTSAQLQGLMGYQVPQYGQSGQAANGSSGWHPAQPGSPQYSQPDPAFVDANGHMWSQQERDQASMQWSRTHDSATGALLPQSQWGG